MMMTGLFLLQTKHLGLIFFNSMYFKCSFFYLFLGRSTIYTSCARPRDENSKANCCHKRLSETKTEMKKNLEEVALFYAFASTIIHSSVYCFPFHTHLSSNLDALGQGAGGCWGSTLALRIWNRLGAQSGSQWRLDGWDETFYFRIVLVETMISFGNFVMYSTIIPMFSYAISPFN